MVPLLASSCGGSAPPKATGPSHTVAAPASPSPSPDGWTDTRTGATVVARRPGRRAARLGDRIPLAKPYSAALFATAAKELDGVAAKLARASGGTVTESVTTTVDGQEVRAYRFTAHPPGKPSTDDRIGFLLEGRHEYQLLCRAPAGSGDPDGACALLFGRFAARLE